MMTSGDLCLLLRTLSFGLYYVADGPSLMISLYFELTYTSGLILADWRYGLELVYCPGAGPDSTFLWILPLSGLM